MSSSATSKRRDSCNACATSKIKCPKERPSCSRCQTRGVSCNYSFTKRPGRKPENGTRRPSNEATGNVGDTLGNHDAGAETDHNHYRCAAGNGDQPTTANQTRQPSLGPLLWTQSPTPAAMTPGSSNNNNNNNNTFGTNPDPNSNPNAYFDITHPTGPGVVASPGLEYPSAMVADSPDVFSMLGDISTFPDFDGSQPKLDKFLESAIESSLALPVTGGGGGSGVGGGITITQAQNDVASLLIPTANQNANNNNNNNNEDDNISASEAPQLAVDTATGNRCSSTLSSLSTPSSSSRLLHQFPGVTESSSCGHLAQILDIFKTLSSAQPSRLATFTGSDTSSGGGGAHAFTQEVLRGNQQSIDTVGTILASSRCGEDSFLLAVLSMIVLKILQRYDAAAQVQPPQTKPDWGEPRFANSKISHQRAPGGRHNHRAALVHDDSSGGEIAAAKLVLGELHRVQRLVNELSHEFEKHRKTGGDHVTSNGEKSTRPLVTTSTLAQLETDMRDSLKALSTEIIDRLRQR